MSAPFSSDQYLDNFTAAYYDISYRSENGNLSCWVVLEYADAALLDFNIADIAGFGMTSEAALAARADAEVGAQARLFPASVNSSTAPRLWLVKQGILETMDDYNLTFIIATLPVVMFIITMPLSVNFGKSPSAASSRIPRSRFPRFMTGAGAAAEEEGALTNRQFEEIVKWGKSAKPAGVADTVARTQSLTKSNVADMVKSGLTKQSVEKFVGIYKTALGNPVMAKANPQLLPRLDLMRKILELWPK